MSQELLKQIESHFARVMPSASSTVWGSAILLAAERGKFTAPDKTRSLNWTTCACGQHSSNIPTGHRGEPKDVVLRSLGNKFSYAVRLDEVMDAAVGLTKIEQRVEYCCRNNTSEQEKSECQTTRCL